MSETCEFCKFCRPLNNSVFLRCCYNPPTVVPSIFIRDCIIEREGMNTAPVGDLLTALGIERDGIITHTGWPIVAKSDWCGKFEGGYRFWRSMVDV
jgi:hypothetical protein